MSIVDTALSFLGKVQYDFGGNNIPGGYGDCSAFTQYVYNQNGYTIGRDTRTQVQQGKEVKKKNLQKGDLIFFAGTYRNDVSHVGIYIGDEKMVHLCSRGVVIDSIADGSYWSSYYLTSRRIISGSTPADDGVSSDTVVQDPQVETGTGSPELKWWGDLLLILLIITCILFAIFFLYKSFAEQIDGAISDGKEIVKTVAAAVGGE